MKKQSNSRRTDGNDRIRIKLESWSHHVQRRANTYIPTCDITKQQRGARATSFCNTYKHIAYSSSFTSLLGRRHYSIVVCSVLWSLPPCLGQPTAPREPPCLPVFIAAMAGLCSMVVFIQCLDIQGPIELYSWFVSANWNCNTPWYAREWNLGTRTSITCVKV